MASDGPVQHAPGLPEAAKLLVPDPATTPAPLADPFAAPVHIPHHAQQTDYTCGPAALRMILDALWGVSVAEHSLAQRLGTDPRIGTRQRVIEHFVQELGLAAKVRHTDSRVEEIRSFMADGHLVLVCYWLEDENTDHYAVVVGVGPETILLHDPWHGPDTELPLEAFDAAWRSDPAVSTRRDRWMLAIKVPSGAP